MDHGILKAEDQPAYRELVRFRNRAVHLYDEIDNSEIYKILHEDLEDLENFLTAIVVRYFKEE